MKDWSYLGIALLSIAILSYGLSGSVYAQISAVSISTDMQEYTIGDTIDVSIEVRTESRNAITLQIFYLGESSPKIISVGQGLPDESGVFTTSFVIGGAQWKIGSYEILATYGQNSATTTFTITEGEPAEQVPQEPAPQEPVPQEPVPQEPVPQEPVPQEPVPQEPVPQEPISQEPEPSGCLIATAAYGTELAPQVQLLREVRDTTLLSTAAGTAFMTGFNNIYYSFSPAIADLERESPLFREVVKALITPMLSTLSLMTMAEENSESQVLSIGLLVIALNLAIYVAAPAAGALVLKRRLLATSQTP